MPPPSRRPRQWGNEDNNSGDEGSDDDDMRKTKDRRMAKKRELGLDDEELFPSRRANEPKKLRRLNESDDDESDVEDDKKETIDFEGAVSQGKPTDLGFKVTTVREDVGEKEYSDDEEEAAEAARRGARDRWLDEVDQGVGNARFENEVKKDKLLKARAEEHRKLEERLEQRADAHLSDLQKVQKLIALLPTPKTTPNDLMRKIKEEAQGGNNAQTKGAKAKGWRPQRLSPELQARMDEIIELCDGLMLAGINVYTESQQRLKQLASGMEASGGQKVSQKLLWLFRRSPNDAPTGPYTLEQLSEELQNVSDEVQGKSQIQQVTEESEPVDGLWILASAIDWKSTRREVT